MNAISKNTHVDTSYNVVVHDNTNDETLVGVKVTIPELKLSAKTNKAGAAGFDKLTAGSFRVYFEMGGYFTRTQIVELEEGEKLNQKVRLQKLG